MYQWLIAFVLLAGLTEAVCVCPNGVPTTPTGTNGTLCAVSNSTVIEDCSGCLLGYHLSAPAGLGTQTCISNICTCKNGVPSGNGTCLIENVNDCASCDANYTMQYNDRDTTHSCLPWCDAPKIDLCELVAEALKTPPYYYNHTDGYSYAHDCASLFPGGECLLCTEMPIDVTCRNRNCQQQPYCPPNFDFLRPDLGFPNPVCNQSITGNWPAASATFSNAMCGRKCSLYQFKPAVRVRGANNTVNPNALTYQCLQCLNGFYGPFCDECPGGYVAPCNGHGTCNAYGNCECDDGYVTSSCNYTSADCHSRGTPRITNGVLSCDCDPNSGWDPATMCATCLVTLPTQQWFYHNTTFVLEKPEFCAFCAADGSTCNFHGSCRNTTNYNDCICDPGYTGAHCEQCEYSFYPQNVNTSLCTPCLASDKCRGHGVCNPTNGSCICDFPFAGPNGTCSSCRPGYFGPSCLACAGYVNAGTPSCFGRGVCDDGFDGTGTCTCNPGFAGTGCQFTSAQSCSGHGRVWASASDTIVGCQCDLGFAPPTCQSCLKDYYGPNCTRCGEETCSGTGLYFSTGSKGRCQLDGSCLCDPIYSGANCELCAAGRYFYPRCVVCNASTCSNHGSCAADGTCSCSLGWAGVACEDCAPGFAGPTCAACQCGGSRCLSGTSQSGACVCDNPFRGSRCQDPVISLVLPVQSPTAGGNSVRIIGYYLTGAPSVVVGGRTNNRTCTSPVASSSPACTNCTEISCVLPATDPAANGQALILVTTAAGTASFAYDFSAPFISSITFAGTANTTGVSVSINGINFGEYATVSWDSAPGVSLVGTHNRIVFNAPAGTGTIPVSVTVAGQLSPAFYFTYAAPVITGVSSLSTTTAGSGTLTIAGRNFGITPGDVVVMVGDRGCPVASTVQGQITCQLPPLYGEQNVAVTVNGQTSTSIAVFTYGSPAILAVSGCVLSGNTTIGCLQAVATTITVTGFNFGFAAPATGNSGALEVRVGRWDCSNVIVTVNDTKLTCLLPAGGFGQNVAVVVRRVHPSGVIQTVSANFLSFEGPTLTRSTLSATDSSLVSNATYHSVNVNSNLGGQNVLITGTGFGGSIPAVTVHFFASLDPNNANLSVASFYTDCVVNTVQATLINCTLSTGVGRNLIFQVSVGGVYSDYSQDLLSHPFPSATSLNGGTSPVAVTGPDFILTFGGANFGGSAFLNQIVVTYGPSADRSLYQCIPLPASTDSSLQCLYGGGSLAGMLFRIWVGAYNAAAYTEPTLTIDGLASPSITGVTLPVECTASRCPTNAYTSGLVLTLSVSNLVGVPVVRIGPLDCTDIRVVGNQVTCRIPDFSGKSLAIVVSHDVLASSGAFALSYQDPVITAVSGSCIDGTGAYLCFGGETITVTGSNFGPETGLMVLIQGVPCNNLNKLSEGSLTCELPVQWSRTPSMVSIAQQSGDLSNAFAVNLYSGCNPGTFFDFNINSCSGCPAGTFQSGRGQSTCTSCAFGKFSSSSSPTCTSCSPGRYSTDPVAGCQDASPGMYCPKYGMASCLACPPGSYSANSGAISCNLCLAFRGEYSTGVNRTSCSVCALGKFPAQDGQTTCVSCRPGYHTFNTAAEGFYGGSPVTTCNPCSVGTFFNPALLPALPCQNCSPGRFSSVPAALECTLCQAGTFGTTIGATTCSPCAAGKAGTGLGATICSLCVPGKYSTEIGLADCFECPVNTWSNISGNVAGCVNCPAGQETIGTGRTSCQACPVGKAIAGGGKRCAFCAPGKYANTTGLTACFPASLDFSTANAGAVNQAACPLGTEARKPGSISCTDCPVGSFNNRSAVGCQPCSPGTYRDSPKGVVCSKCAPGFYSYQWGQGACLPCGVGKFSTANGTSDCVACPVGYIQPLTGKTSCNVCPNASTTFRTGATTCSSCPPGSQLDLAAPYGCRKCPLGKYRAGMFTTGIAGSPLDTGFCQTCPAGKIALDTGLLACQDCQPAHYCPNSTVQLDCPKGYYAGDFGMTACLPCPPGQFGLAGQQYCIQCFPGTYQNQSGTDACIDCEQDFPRGYGNAHFGASFMNNSDDRTSCFHTKPGYKLVDKFWQLCPPGTDSSQDEYRQICASCVPGKYSKGSMDFEDGCQPCEVGKTQPAPGQTECIKCGVGRYFGGPVRDGNPYCFACEPGSYGDSQGLTACSPCQPGRNAPAVGDQTEAGKGVGITACRPCTPGRFMSSIGSNDDFCTICPKGRYQNTVEATTCIPCPPGSYSGVAGAASCVACERREIAPAPESTNCTACPEGQHWETEAVTCVRCPPGKDLSSTDGDGCDVCGLGKYMPPNASFPFCQNCPAGQFADQEAQTSCDLCPPGKFQGVPGSQMCNECPDATYTNTSGMLNCTICEPGRYGPVGTHVTCYECQLGRATAGTGTIESCTICEPGKFANTTGQKNCTICVAGRASASVESKVECDICPVGRFAFAQQSSCSDCGPGRIAFVPGVENCSDCAFGVPANVQHTVCLCPKDYYVDPFRKLNAEGKVDCQRCPIGADCSQQGSLDCRDDSLICQKQGVLTESGYWRGTAMNFYRCLLPEHCCAGNSTFNCCNQNRGGFLCASCLPGTSANSILGACDPCPEASSAFAVTVVIVIVIFIAAVIMFFILLRADAALIRAMEEADKQALEWDQFHSALHFETRREFARSVSAKNLQKTVAGDNQKTKSKSRKGYVFDFSDSKDYDYRESPVGIPGERHDVNYQNYTYKIKIIIGFLQINTSCVFQLKVPWPRVYETFINFFSIVNLDFVPWQNLSCVTPYTFYDKYLALTILPISAFIFFCGFFVVFVKLWQCYLVTRKEARGESVGAREERESGERKVIRTIRKFWKLALFTIFLAFPGVCTKTLSFFLCLQSDDSYFLYADVNVQCYDSLWYSYLPWAVICIFIYPVAVPLGFLAVLLYFRKKFRDPGVKLQTGFLYDAYTPGLWWFEMIDIAHKLFMTSILAFVGRYSQMPVGLGVLGLYLILIIVIKPYTRTTDDTLHLTCQMELLMLCLVGYRLTNQSLEPLAEFGSDGIADFTGVLLIAMTVIVLIIFVLFAVKFLRTLIFSWIAKRRQRLRRTTRGMSFSLRRGASFRGSNASDDPESESSSMATEPVLAVPEVPIDDLADIAKAGDGEKNYLSPLFMENQLKEATTPSSRGVEGKASISPAATPRNKASPSSPRFRKRGDTVVLPPPSEPHPDASGRASNSIPQTHTVASDVPKADVAKPDVS